MASKLLIYNDKTGEVKSTVADTDGKVYKNYLAQGFKPIGWVTGWNTSVSSLPEDERNIQKGPTDTVYVKFGETVVKPLKQKYVYLLPDDKMAEAVKLNLKEFNSQLVNDDLDSICEIIKANDACNDFHCGICVLGTKKSFQKYLETLK